MKCLFAALASQLAEAHFIEAGYTLTKSQGTSSPHILPKKQLIRYTWTPQDVLRKAL